MTRKPKKPVHHVEMTEGKREIIRGLLEEYDIERSRYTGCSQGSARWHDQGNDGGRDG